MNLIPRMHGSWSIWLSSVTYGVILAYPPNPLAILSSLFFLFSVEPTYSLLKGSRKLSEVFFPALFVASLGLLLNREVIAVLLIYTLIFALQLKFKENFRTFTALGSILMTFPFPLIATASGLTLFGVLRHFVALILLVIFSFSAVIYRNLGLKAPLLASTLPLLALTVEPSLLYASFLVATVLIPFVVKKLSLKSVGKLILSYQIFSVVVFVAIL